MEEQIKKEVREASICFESSGDNLVSLSFIEKYDQFLQNDYSPGSESEHGEDFPDDTFIRQEYAQIRRDTAHHARFVNNHRLSTGLPGKYGKKTNSDRSSSDEGVSNGAANDSKSSVEFDKKSLTGLSELIEKLASVRRTDSEFGPDGNSLFCSESELDAIRERYSEILTFFNEKSSKFEKITNSAMPHTPNGPKDPDDDDQSHQPDSDEQEVEPAEDESDGPEKSEEMKMLSNKIESVEEARDRFYEVELQVKEQLDLLELVERYKMESVG